MKQQEIHQFLKRFFLANDCELVEDQQGYMIVQLTIDLDKELMNRPFYWHYLEKTGGVPNPARLTLITDPNHAPKDLKGELIHFGAPRLHQLFACAKKLSGYIRLYENIPGQMSKHVALKPWLSMNVKISYQCDRKRDVFRSIGLQLINGQLVDNFHETVQKFNLSAKIPDYCFTLSPLIMPKSGMIRIENTIRQAVLQEDHQWAADARERWAKDLNLLEHFYEDAEEELIESLEMERLALKEQYEPKVNVSIINGGLFYLASEAM
ncbi:YqhG family protein [Niallia taxi]|uniref:YqhG family protein n=1 Tax=Niallia taxi TaxID=2499688 RepID=UPI002E24ED33|nr:YqhG family protein [Niallia taxi]